MIDLNKLAAQIHDAAVNKGFWNVEDAMNKHLVKMVSELGEVVQADRAGVMFEIDAFSGKPEGVAAELADLIMMQLDMCVQLEASLPDEDIDSWIENKDDDAEIAKLTVPELVAMLTVTLVDMTRHNDNSCILEIIYVVYIWLHHRGFDLWEIIRQKMAYNEARPALHGRLY